LSDKKREGASISLVLPETIGKAVTKKVGIEGLAEFLRIGMTETDGAI